MKTIEKQNNFLAYLWILVAFFVLLFFTKSIFESLQVSLDERDMGRWELEEKQEELKKLNDLQAMLQEGGEETLWEIKRFMTDFSDVDMLEYIHTYAVGVNSGDDRIIIRSINYKDNIKTDIGFRKAEIGVSIVVSSENALFKFLSHLTSDTEKYPFYIDGFSYPMNQISWNIQVTVPLSLYYK